MLAAGAPIARGALVSTGPFRRTVASSRARVSRAAAFALHVVVACEPSSQGSAIRVDPLVTTLEL